MTEHTLTEAIEDASGRVAPLPSAAETLVPEASRRPPSAPNPFDTPVVAELTAARVAAMRHTTVFPRHPAPGQPPTGSQPMARYEPLRTLGVGGYGEVDLVRDNDIDRLVARKRLRPEMQFPAAVDRFAREVRVVGRLEHPSIVPVHDVGLDEHGYFFLMKYVEGETLEDIIRRVKSADPDYDRLYTYEYRTQIFMQVLRAMQCAHDRGIVHRDIKPANVMVGRWGEVLVLDWGIARQIASDPPESTTDGEHKAPVDPRATAEGWLMGTPAFMSPEQARGENNKTDARSDVYGLCALFYEFLTLEHYLTPKDTTEALLAAIQTEEPLGAVAIHHKYGVPPELTFTVVKGLAKDPAKRYQSVGQLLDRLQSVTEGLPQVQCPCTGLKRTGGLYSRFLNRHPIAAVTCAVLTACCTVVGLVDVVARLVARVL